MTAEQTKSKIKEVLQSFSKGNLSQNSIKLFDTLGYKTERQSPLDNPAFKDFKESYILDKEFREDKALVSDWKYIDLLFQLSKEEIEKQANLFDTNKVDNTAIEAYLFFTIELSDNQYTRTELANITREINRLFPMPVMILFKYNNTLTLSVINRRINFKDVNKDVLLKVTQIKDINIENPHRAHIEILFDLTFDELYRKFSFINFVELHNAWQKTLDTKELNKRFYSELFNWYLWAVKTVNFPNDVNDDKDDMAYNAESVIRLLTRLIFVWFIKEKKLVPEELFEINKLKNILKDFKPNSSETSVYYRAILQNLFFATLNTPMDKDITDENSDEKRKFINTLPRTGNDHYLDQTKYRYQDLFIYPDKALELFSSIPFLNGGLFECLDFKEGNKEIRYDGFSSTEKRQAFVADKLFFANEFILDFNSEYGTKGKTYKVEGIINILNSYKFTITENTPLEEEIALDPELLGKVFENLLASFNPETQSTARKQTGSFYTPREIVNYMVDESLIAHLKQKLDNTEETELKLRNLFSHTDVLHQFSGIETDTLIKALSEAKILDPACGSGAFPMGILHRMVDLLKKLDPDNEKWNALQIGRAIAETSEVFKSGDVTEREIRLNEINKAFDLSMNYPDYARKLFLIENCIYGVDIQQIAIQISKLRFFISLMVDQKVDDNKSNRNILSMPNLETKFVAANTLIGLDKPMQMMLMADEVDTLENELGSIRHKIFFTRKYSAKKELKKIEKTKREELKKALMQSGFGENTASQMAGWNPFDPMQSASFFDTETMFGIKEGFDVVIGNPPYVSVKAIPDSLKKVYSKYYIAGEGRFNLFTLFIEKGFKVLNSCGSLTFIIPEGIYSNIEYRHIRKLLLEKTRINRICLFSNRVFEASVDTTVLSFTNKTEFNERIAIDKDISKTPLSLSQKKISRYPFYLFPTKLNEYTSTIVDKAILSPEFDRISNCLEIQQGIIYSGQEKEDVFSNEIINNSYKKCLDGRDVLKWFINWQEKLENKYISFTDKLHRAREERLYIADKKILIPRRATSIYGTIDDMQFYVLNTAYICLPINSLYSIEYLLALLNSKYINFIYNQLFFGWQITIPALDILPVKKISRATQKPFIYLIDKILTAKKANPKTDTSTLEKQIDVMVFKLYDLTYEEVQIVCNNEFWLTEEEYNNIKIEGATDIAEIEMPEQTKVLEEVPDVKVKPAKSKLSASEKLRNELKDYEF